MKKAIVLFLVILLPLLIFTFLKFFGSNQFDIPVFYENGVDTSFVDCDYDEGPHLVNQPFTELDKGDDVKGAELSARNTVYYLSQDPGSKSSQSVRNQVRRVVSRFYDWEEIMAFILENNEEEIPNNLRKDEVQPNIIYSYTDLSALYQYARCNLIMDLDTAAEQNNTILVLVDKEDRIRGYYDATQLEEIDRLIDEIGIIKKNSE